MKLKYWLITLLLIFTPLSVNAEELSAQLKESLDSAIPKAKKINGDATLFLALTKPFAPLDLNIREKLDNDAASEIKNLYFGVLSAAAGFGREDSTKMVKSFFSKYQGDKVIDGASAKAEAVQRLIKLFQAETNIEYIAAWAENSFRVNDIIVIDDTVTIFQCEKHSYFPCSLKEEKVINTVSTTIERLINSGNHITLDMRNLNLVALVKQEKGIRAIIDGLADNEVGFYSPSNGQMVSAFSDGKEVVFAKPLSSGIFFYAAN
jgi:hypothetical protein